MDNYPNTMAFRLPTKPPIHGYHHNDRIVTQAAAPSSIDGNIQFVDHVREPNE